MMNKDVRVLLQSESCSSHFPIIDAGALAMFGDGWWLYNMKPNENIIK